MEIINDDYCFACGARNPIGLKLRFDVDAAARTAVATFTPRPEHQGYADITHGGILATVLDEAMMKLCRELGIPAVTARLEVEFKKPAAPGETLTVRGWIDADRGRVIATRAEITASDGALVARARATAVAPGAGRSPCPGLTSA